jgi:hypothetical protein
MVPSQIAPIVSFFFVFNLPSPFPNAIFLCVIGIGCILCSAVFLAQRQAQINNIEEPHKKS